MVARAAPGVRALGTTELLGASSGVCAATAKLLGARWADVFGQRRIVSHWLVDTMRVLAGTVPRSFELSTLGGVVNEVVQWVPHEARLVADTPQVLFLMPGPLGTLWVSGMLQGAYSLQPSASDDRVVLTAEQVDVARDPNSACARLAGCSLDGVEQVLAAAARS